MRRTTVGTLLVLAACHKDNSLGVIHEPPIVSITQPSEGAEFYDGQTIAFAAAVQAGSASDLVTDITTTWVTGTTTMCGSTPVAADGTATCDYAFDTIGDATVTVTALDTRGDTSQATVDVTILEDTPPTITVLDPVDGASYEPGDLVKFDVSVDDAEDSPDQLVVTVEDSVDGDLGFTSSPASDGSWTAATSKLSSGEHLVVFRVTDTSGRSGQASLTLTVNGSPGAPVVHIDPDPAPSGEQLDAKIDVAASDPQGDALTYTYDWYKDGTLYQSGTNPRVNKGVTHRGEYWEVSVTPHDAYHDGAPGTASITIDNSPPMIDAVDITPTSPSTDDDLVATGVNWFDQDADPEQYHIRWFRNGTEDLAEKTDTYPASKTVRGDLVQAEFTPYDSYEDGTPVLSPTITVGDSVPTTPGVAVTPTAPEPDDGLTCKVTVSSTDADGDPITYQYNWYQNGTLTSYTTYVVPSGVTVEGDTWECRVTPYDGLSYGAYGSASVSVHDATPPDPPIIEAPTAYRNEDTVDLSGDCEADCDLVIYCADSATSWTETDTCMADGTFDHSISLTRGETTDCWATCTDAVGNTSAVSNTVTTEVCSPYDTYEDSSGTGDTVAAKIDKWSVLADDATTTVTIDGNALDYADEDWYVITTSDDNTKNVSASDNEYNFHVNMTTGSSDYVMKVYKGSSVSSGYPSTPECSSTTGGYTEYNDYVSTKACKSGSVYGYNNCEDMSDVYYIQVKHLSTKALSCQYYELTITNGVW